MIDKYALKRAIRKLSEPVFRTKLKACSSLLIDDIGRWAESIEEARKHSLGEAIVQVALPTFYEGVNTAINYPPPEPPLEAEVKK